MIGKEEKSFEELHNIALKVAANIHRNDKVEYGRSIDKYGNVAKFSGDLEYVDITINKDTRITVHNHPGRMKVPETFSGDDVYYFIENEQLLEIIVCGYGYYFYLRRGTFKKRGRDALKIRSKIKNIFTDAKKRVLKEYASNPANYGKTLKTTEKEICKITEDEIHKEVNDYLISKGLSYGRVKL